MGPVARLARSRARATVHGEVSDSFPITYVGTYRKSAENPRQLGQGTTALAAIGIVIGRGSAARYSSSGLRASMVNKAISSVRTPRSAKTPPRSLPGCRLDASSDRPEEGDGDGVTDLPRLRAPGFGLGARLS